MSLERRKRAGAGADPAPAREAPFRLPASGNTIRVIYQQTVQFVSGRCVLVESARGLTIVFWQPVVERSLGREVVGFVTDRGISWQVGRDRGMGL